MFKVNIKSNLRADVQSQLRKLVDDRFVQEVQREVVGEITRMVQSGTPPVKSVEGGRRFKGYKNPNNYPGNKKAKRPVSLVLTGIMLAWYRAKRISGVRLSLGIPSEAPRDVKERAIANNEGTVNSSGHVAIAARRFIPLNGETYVVSVVRKLKNVYARRIRELLSK